MSLFIKIIPALVPTIVFWGIFIYVVLMVPYPQTFTQANIIQLLSFFIPLFLALIFTINIFLNFLIRSILISATLIIFLILQALQSLSLLTFILTSCAFGLLISYFKKKRGLTPIKSGLTSNLKIRKLTHK